MAGETTKQQQQGGLQLANLRVSPFGKRCRIALAEKGLAYECLEQDLGNKSEFLLHDGRAISESLIILHKAFPQNSQLLPPNQDGYIHKKKRDPQAQEQARTEMLEILKTLEGELVEKENLDICGKNEDGYEFTDVALEPFTAWFLLRYERFWEFSLEEEFPRLAGWAKQCGERESLKEQENRLQLARARAPAIVLSLSEEEKPLRRMAASFEKLASVTKQSPAGAMDVGAFSRACSTVSVLFGCLGLSFKFAEMDYVSKVDDLLEASKSISTLPSMIELDIQKHTVRETGSHTRNLLRVKRGIDSIKALFEQILITEGDSLRNAAPVAYAQVFGPHHCRAMRMAVTAALYVVPSKSQLLKKLNEDEESAKVQMRNFVRSSAPVILYVEDQFISRNLGIDW